MSEALHQMNFQHLEFLPVLSSTDSQKLVGVLTRTDLIVAYDTMAQKINESAVRPNVEIDDLEKIPVRELMLMKYDSIKEETPLGEILALEETSSTIDLPVVDDEGNFLGLVIFNDLRAALLHNQVHSLVIAVVKFVNHDFDLLPVVYTNNTHSVRLIGIVRRADVMKRYRRLLNPNPKDTNV